MNPETKPPLLLKEDSHSGESRALNISLRGWIALLVVITFCTACLLNPDPVDKLKDVALMVLTFYFVTKPNPPKP